MITLSTESQRYFPGQTEMARRMREFDWARTSLGPVETWPQSLRTSVSTCLDCAFPIVLWWGPDHVILYNDEYRPMLGPGKHPSALGQPGAQIWPEIWEVIGPMLHQVYERGEATRSRDLLLHIDRGYREEAYFSFSYSPILDENGKVAGIFCPVIETTEKVIGERRLRTLRDLAAKCKGAASEHDVYQSAAEVLEANRHDIPFALIYAIDDDQSVATLKATSGIEPGGDASPRILELSENTEGIWSLSRVARTGLPTLMTGLSTDFERLPSGAWKTPAESAMVLPVMRPGQERPHAILVGAISPMRALDADYGTFFNLVATQIASALADARALEQERQRAEALAEIDRAKTTFFSNVSHEFRTPLTLMLGPIEDLMRNAGGVLPQSAVETLQIAHRNGLRLLKLVNTLLDFARIEAGRVDASYELTDLPSFTAELASTFRSATEKAGLRLVIDCPPFPEAEKVYVDRDMWEKIVLNLLSNAFKFTFEGEIRVGLRALAGKVELTVTDTGSGIPESDLPKMFQRFHRVRNTRSRTHEGSGIGLALVQELARLHGGEVAVQSEEGRGSSFSICIKTGKGHLPEDRIGAARNLSSSSTGENFFVEEALRWLPEQEDERTNPADAPHPTLHGIPEVSIGLPREPRISARVLVADDNADMRNYLARLLSRDYAVTAVADGAAALESIQTRMPDLVLTDVMMPRLDGFGLLEAIRADEKMRALPVIMLSARAGEESRIEGLAAAADDYLTKPFSARELLARISSQLQLVRMRREIEESLKDEQKKKDEFIAMLAHELRGPLAPLQNMLQVLNHLGGKTKPAQDARTVMERQLKHLARLVDDLLDVSRIARNSIELRKTRFDLNAIVRQAVETCGPLADSLQHEVHLNLPEAPIYLDADAVRIGQVLSNLLNNACKYTNRQGNIWIHAEQEGGSAIVKVRDTGLGIPPDSLDRIFEMFAQVERTLDHSQGGLGIGLTLVKRLVELHGGTISVQSEGIAGHGSEFTVRLPLPVTEPEEAPASSEAFQSIRHNSGGLRRILVVDDNVDSAQSLAMLLSISGDQTRMAHDGMQAVLQAKEYDPHIVLLDIGLPKLNGYDTCREIRKLAGGAHIRIIAITGWGQEVDRAKSKDAGFDAHLVKPVEYDKLVNILETLSEGRPPE